MTHKIGDRIKEMASSVGTGAFALLGAVAGFDAFSAIPNIAVGDTTWYCAVNANEWEIGVGTYNGTSSLARTTVLQSSNADVLVNFSAPPVVFCTVPASALNPGVLPPAFAARASAAQSITGNQNVKLSFGTEELDSHGYYDPATSRFMPALSGWYDLAAALLMNDGAAYTDIKFYKNGVLLKAGTSANAVQGVSVRAMVYLNGTDYVEVFVYSTSTRLTHTTQFGEGVNFFGHYVRP